MALPTMTAATEDDPAPHRSRPSPDTLVSRRPWLAIQLVATSIAALLVVAVEGLSVIAVWNLIPLFLALGSLAITRSSLGSRDVRVAVAVFWATQIAVAMVLHVAWAFDLGEVATRSSTAGLIFLVIPIYSVVLGFLLAGASMVLHAVIVWAQRGA